MATVGQDNLNAAEIEIELMPNDFESVPFGKLQELKNRLPRKRLILAMVFALVLGCFLVGQSAIIMYYIQHTSLPAPGATEIAVSTEYQLGLFSDDWDTTAKRDVMAKAILNDVNSFLGSSLTTDDGQTSLRRQFYYPVNGGHRCGSDYTVRAREYIEGPFTGTKYVDIKGSSKIESKACGLPLQVSPVLPFNIFSAESTTQKCEHDVHACGTKYSRVTRAFYREDIEDLAIFTCSDVATIWPWAFEGMAAKQKFNPANEKAHEYFWYVWDGEVYLNEDGHVTPLSAGATRVSISLTLQYDTVEEARSGDATPGHRSEWSVKTHANDNGLTDPIAVEKVSAMYDMLLKKYESRGEYEDGTCV